MTLLSENRRVPILMAVGIAAVLMMLPPIAGAQISPDGQAFAYVSNELGEDRVYLRRYPDVGTVWPISGVPQQGQGRP